MILETILAALRATSAIAQWQVTETAAVRHERYLTFLTIESERRASATRWQVWLALVAVDGKHGEASFTLGSSEDEGALQAALTAALAAAAAAPNRHWLLPVPGAPGTATPPTDPSAGCDPGLLSEPTVVLDELVAAYRGALPADVRPSTLELFATLSERRLLNHNGLDLRDRSTRLYAEFVLLHQPDGQAEVEFFDRTEAACAADLYLAERVAAAVACVRDGAQAQPTPPGNQPVLITDAYAAELIDYYAHHTDAALHVRKIAAFSEGQAIVVRRGGDPLTLVSDPAVPSLAAYAFDPNGWAATVQPLVTADVISGLHGSGRWQQALGRPPHGTLGTQVVAPGSTPLAALRSGVLEVVRFSEFSPRADTGAFSGEIRLAYLHGADGSRTPVAGGSVSGVLKEALADARFSHETVTIGGYQGPQGIRLAQVTVAG